MFIYDIVLMEMEGVPSKIALYSRHLHMCVNVRVRVHVRGRGHGRGRGRVRVCIHLIKNKLHRSDTPRARCGGS